MKKYLLFDLDGTLTDPKIGITTCVQYALKSFGIEEPDLDKLEPFIGPPLKESFMTFYGMDEAQAEKAVEKYRERFRDIGLFENQVYDGIPAMLRTLRAKGMHLAVASSKPTVFVERILEHFHMDKYFEVVVGSELDGRRVNKDEVVLEALNRLFHNKPIQREQIYMIGDRKFDVEGAKTHQIESVAVAYGYGSMEELKAAKADYIVRSVEELKMLLLRETEQHNVLLDGPKATPVQKIGAIVFPLLLFLLVRMVAMSTLLLLVNGIGISLTGNAKTIITALSYMVAAFTISNRAKMLITKMAYDMRLSHLKREPAKNYVLLVLAGVGSVLGWNLLFNLLGFIDQSASYQAVAAEQYSASFLVGLICYGFITPMAEELLFRGTLYNYLRRFTNIRMAIIVSALIFGFYHMNVIQGIYGFFIGSLMAYGYEYFGRFKVSVLIHVIANLLAYCLSYIPIAIGGFMSWLVCVICLVAAVGCVIGLHRKKNIF